ncbi:hypothetical protein SORBI_3003G257501 [Sorghum bicolor]|uniref:Uncharacterized protein n=1 Tax=Sorghum bicolor TaxID=4558 RepID=A0A1W0VYX8_SORBI|nr:hypothetical protein SORBI_3003G257501 [Sorghum bicolor]
MCRALSSSHGSEPPRRSTRPAGRADACMQWRLARRRRRQRPRSSISGQQWWCRLDRPALPACAPLSGGHMGLWLNCGLDGCVWKAKPFFQVLAPFLHAHCGAVPLAFLSLPCIARFPRQRSTIAVLCIDSLFSPCAILVAIIVWGPGTCD